MNALQQPATQTQPDTPSQSGWILSTGVSRQARQYPHMKKSYISASKKEERALGKTSPRYQARWQTVVLSRTSEVLELNYQRLSAHLVDGLAEKNFDWISVLPNDWHLKISNFSLLDVKNFHPQWNQRTPSVETLVQLTKKSHYYPVVISKKTYWSYTCCLQVAELGRVRFVVYFQDTQHCGKYTALITNRLDWSPRKIMTQHPQLLA